MVGVARDCDGKEDECEKENILIHFHFFHFCRYYFCIWESKQIEDDVCKCGKLPRENWAGRNI